MPLEPRALRPRLQTAKVIHQVPDFRRGKPLGIAFHIGRGAFRDRRKDLLLQRSGLLVLRFLADDVIERLEVVSETILDNIAYRRHSAEEHGS